MKYPVLGDDGSKSVSCTCFSVYIGTLFKIESLLTEYFIQYIQRIFSDVRTAYFKSVSSTAEKRVVGLLRELKQLEILKFQTLK